ncbi:arylamine N-acetyltransferase [Allosaccharopolyspora coralli]|uniref:Arylamine N-acetyltransferase n=1 Tax=Allosaccharopolyspora coralli TaxID=2665642 RepID=A0A5Q3QII8_9PSEU|nr:arylamine N-acetyltransferase [Allosaccharopolyspora coralli]QGK70667.1 arylamine N-acetyltransferase [Allosaccharopolyspora coralli]
MSTSDPWNTAALDLEGYLTRLGVPRRAPSHNALDQLHESHVQTFTFDNIDVLLDQHPGVELPAVNEKFVGRGRGGYCFEHSVLFAAAVERLGYPVHRRLGRVGDPTQAPRAHMVVEVVLDDQRLLADPGFGMSIPRPIALTHGAQVDHRGRTYRMQRIRAEGGVSWELQRQRGSEWERMHTTDELAVHPVDITMGHQYTSTHSAFRSQLMLSLFDEDGTHTTVTHNTVTVRRPEGETEHRGLEADELDQWLDRLRVPLTPHERHWLNNRATKLRSEESPATQTDTEPESTLAS